MHAARQSIMDAKSVLIFVGFISRPESSENKAASSDFHFNRTIKVEYVVESVIIVPDCRDESDNQISIPRDRDSGSRAVALKRIICCVLEDANAVCYCFCVFPEVVAC